MARFEFLLRGIRKDMLGIEIGPFHAPLVPKAEGYRSLSLDFMDREGLLARMRQDKHIPPSTYDRIEDVDFVGQASDLASLIEGKGLTGKFDYVISAHNFEHLPNPVRFLKGCEQVLKSDGLVSMAIPDRRGSFDFFRSLSSTAELLEAYHAGNTCPTYSQLFNQGSLASRHKTSEVPHAWNFDDDGDLVELASDLHQTFVNLEAWRAAGSTTYQDVHCFVYIKPSFELIIRELHYLGVIDLGIDDMGGPEGCEFQTRLRKGIPRPSHDEFKRLREDLLKQINDENGGNSRAAIKLKRHHEESKARIAALESRLDRMRRSLSWRLTRPLRMLFDRNAT